MQKVIKNLEYNKFAIIPEDMALDFCWLYNDINAKIFRSALVTCPKQYQLGTIYAELWL